MAEANAWHDSIRTKVAIVTDLVVAWVEVDKTRSEFRLVARLADKNPNGSSSLANSEILSAETRIYAVSKNALEGWS